MLASMNTDTEYPVSQVNTTDAASADLTLHNLIEQSMQTSAAQAKDAISGVPTPRGPRRSSLLIRAERRILVCSVYMAC